MVSVDEFRDRLRRLIDVSGYSQREIADVCQVSQQSISRWKSGASNPPVERVAELTPALERLEFEARKRWEDERPEGWKRGVLDFFRETGLEALTELHPIPTNRQVVWNEKYQQLNDELAARVPLLRAEIPLGHGITTIARTVAERIRASYYDVISVRIGVERLAAHALKKTEEETYRSLLEASYHNDRISQENVSLSNILPSNTLLVAEVETLFAIDIMNELRRDIWRNTLRAKYVQVSELLAKGDHQWRAALKAVGNVAQVIVVLDLSPSPAGRQYSHYADLLLNEHHSRTAEIIRAVSNGASDLPRVSFTVLAPEGQAMDLVELEQVAHSNSWDVIPSPPRLERSDYLNILAAHVGVERIALDRVFDPRFALDLNNRGITSVNFEMTHRIERALVKTGDNAGVLREGDASVSDALMQERLRNLEEKVDRLQELLNKTERVQQEIRESIVGLQSQLRLGA